MKTRWTVLWMLVTGQLKIVQITTTYRDQWHRGKSRVEVLLEGFVDPNPPYPEEMKEKE